MRIVSVVHGWPLEEMGGTGLYVAALNAALRRAGHTVLTLAPGPAGPLALHEERDHARVIAPRPTRFEHTFRRRRLTALITGWLRRVRPDVVHIHHLSGLPLGVVGAARSASCRVVITLHDYALPCARGQLVDRDGQPCPGPAPERCAGCLREHLRLDPLSGAVGAMLQQWPGARAAARRQVADLTPPPHAAARIFDRSATVEAALSAADALLSPSHDLAGRFATMGLPRPVHVALPLIRPVPPAPTAPPGPVRFLFASSIIPTKGPHLLLAAFARLSPGSATLTLIGPTPPFDGQPDFAAQLTAQAARTPGAQLRPPAPAAEVPALLAAHDVLVLPSLWPENSPLIVREATAAGLPVITTTAGGARELARDAVLVPPGDEDALAEALHQETQQGRRRLPPRRWPTPDAHAAALISGVYQTRGVDPRSSG